MCEKILLVIGASCILFCLKLGGIIELVRSLNSLGNIESLKYVLPQKEMNTKWKKELKYLNKE